MIGTSKLLKQPGSLIRSESGSSLVEFAVLLPVLAFLLVGLIDIGRATYYSILAANAARAGSQYGAQYLWTANDTSGISSAVSADAPNISWTVSQSLLCSVGGGAPAACASTGNGSSNTVYYVKVQVNGSFSTLVHYPGLPTSIPVSGLSMTRIITQ
jgi:Flp pilus assembly protein TadG